MLDKAHSENINLLKMIVMKKLYDSKSAYIENIILEKNI